MKYHPVVQDMDTPLHVCPHYSDRRFDREQTVFGAGAEGLGYDYSDRLYQWDSDKQTRARAVAESSGAGKRTARFYQAYLSAYFGKEIALRHVLAGVNRSDGYPYLVFGYEEYNVK